MSSILLHPLAAPTTLFQVITPFPVNAFPNTEAPKVPSNILRYPPPYLSFHVLLFH